MEAMCLKRLAKERSAKPATLEERYETFENHGIWTRRAEPLSRRDVNMILAREGVRAYLWNFEDEEIVRVEKERVPEERWGKRTILLEVHDSKKINEKSARVRFGKDGTHRSLVRFALETRAWCFDFDLDAARHLLDAEKPISCEDVFSRFRDCEKHARCASEKPMPLQLKESTAMRSGAAGGTWRVRVYAGRLPVFLFGNEECDVGWMWTTGTPAKCAMSGEVSAGDNDPFPARPEGSVLWESTVSNERAESAFKTFKMAHSVAHLMLKGRSTRANLERVEEFFGDPSNISDSVARLKNESNYVLPWESERGGRGDWSKLVTEAWSKGTLDNVHRSAFSPKCDSRPGPMKAACVSACTFKHDPGTCLELWSWFLRAEEDGAKVDGLFVACCVVMCLANDGHARLNAEGVIRINATNALCVLRYTTGRRDGEPGRTCLHWTMRHGSKGEERWKLLAEMPICDGDATDGSARERFSSERFSRARALSPLDASRPNDRIVELVYEHLTEGRPREKRYGDGTAWLAGVLASSSAGELGRDGGTAYVRAMDVDPHGMPTAFLTARRGALLKALMDGRDVESYVGTNVPRRLTQWLALDYALRKIGSCGKRYFLLLFSDAPGRKMVRGKVVLRSKPKRYAFYEMNSKTSTDNITLHPERVSVIRLWKSSVCGVAVDRKNDRVPLEDFECEHLAKSCAAIQIK